MQKLSSQNKKLIITNEMLSTFPKHSRHDLRTAFIKWWINSRKTGGLRLTSTGYKLLLKMRYDSHRFKAKKITTSYNLLTMDQYLECPYYIDGLGRPETNIFIFGAREATIINLYENFNSFLVAMKP
jgi:hypothetical protein